MQRVRHPQKLGDRLGDPDVHRVSFVVLFDGWAEDVERLHASLARHCDGWEMVVVDNPVDDEASERIASLDRVVHVPLAEKVGYAGGRNLGLRLATGRIVAVVDTSVEATGDLVGSLERALDDKAVGLAGRWGVRTEEGFHFHDAEGPDVDGVEGYLMAARRALLPEVGLFDAKFKWYRNADLDWTYQIRSKGYRTVIDPSLPVVRHEHRLWHHTPEAQRDDMSRKNFFRFRDHWY